MRDYFYIYRGEVRALELNPADIQLLDSDFALFNGGIIFMREEIAEKAYKVAVAKKINPYVHPATWTLLSPAISDGYKISYITLTEFRTTLGMTPVEEVTITIKEFEDIFMGMRRGILDIASEHEPEQIDYIKSILNPIARELSRAPFIDWDVVTKNFRQIYLMDYIDQKWIYTFIATQNTIIKLITHKDVTEHRRINAKYHSNNLKKVLHR